MEEEDKDPNNNSTVNFNRRLSAAKKLNIIKYARGSFINATSNYYGVSIPKIRYWIKEMEELMKVTKNEHCYII